MKIVMFLGGTASPYYIASIDVAEQCLYDNTVCEVNAVLLVHSRGYCHKQCCQSIDHGKLYHVYTPCL